MTSACSSDLHKKKGLLLSFDSHLDEEWISTSFARNDKSIQELQKNVKANAETIGHLKSKQEFLEDDIVDPLLDKFYELEKQVKKLQDAMNKNNTKAPA